MKERHYSPYAVIATFNDKGWPTETRICEKTLYSYVHESLIPEVTERDLLLKGKGRRPHPGKRNHANAALAAKSITTRPEEVSTREEFGHWEGDTVVSGTGKGAVCLLTITERKTGTEISRRILNGRTPAQMIREEFPDRIMILRFFNIIPKEAS